jgi:hypothetical protein
VAQVSLNIAPCHFQLLDSGEIERKPGLERALESVETPLQLELLACLFAALEQRRSSSCRLLAAQLSATDGAGVSIVFPWVRLLPKALARQEAVLEAGPHHVFEVSVGERV